MHRKKLKEILKRASESSRPGARARSEKVSRRRFRRSTTLSCACDGSKASSQQPENRLILDTRMLIKSSARRERLPVTATL